MKLKTIYVEKNEIENWKDYKRRPANDDDYETLIKEPCRIMCGEELLGVYLTLPKDKENELLRDVVKRTDYTWNRRTSGLSTTSKVFGYLPREIIRKDYCSSSQMATANPKYHAVICKFGETLTNNYKETCPEMFDMHTKITDEKIRPEWVIKNTPYTSGIINKDNQLNYHWDRGNFQKVYSNMLAFKHKCTGGHLALPEYNVGLEIKDLSLTFFAGQEILHGVTPFTTEQGGYRYTLVYYTMKQMWQCEEVTTEVERIRQRKTVREKNRLLRQKGLLSEEDDPIGNLRQKVKDPKSYKNYNLFSELGIDRKYLGVNFTSLPDYIQKKLSDYKRKNKVVKRK